MGRGLGGRLGAGPAGPLTAGLPGFRDCLCVTAWRFPSVLPSGGRGAWPWVLIPDEPALCQAALGSWGCTGGPKG